MRVFVLPLPACAPLIYHFQAPARKSKSTPARLRSHLLLYVIRPCGALSQALSGVSIAHCVQQHMSIEGTVRGVSGTEYVEIMNTVLLYFPWQRQGMCFWENDKTIEKRTLSTRASFSSSSHVDMPPVPPWLASVTLSCR